MSNSLSVLCKRNAQMCQNPDDHVLNYQKYGVLSRLWQLVLYGYSGPAAISQDKVASPILNYACIDNMASNDSYGMEACADINVT